jgi:hypothetical protein
METGCTAKQILTCKLRRISVGHPILRWQYTLEGDGTGQELT